MVGTVLPRKISSRRLLWLGALISLVFLSVMGASFAYLYSGRSPCEFFGSKICLSRTQPPSQLPPRPRTDAEIAAITVARNILRQPIVRSANAKVAFMFLTPGPLPHEDLWEAFFRGHERMYSIYVHASQRATLKSIWKSTVFIGREIPSQKVEWGKIDMVDAERRLLTHALMDSDNEFFALLSDSCIPLHSFNYIYDYFMNASISFVDCFDDPGPHGIGRYLDKMMPEVQRLEFRKGAQWFAVNKKHALLLVADSVYYRKFQDFCKPGEEYHNCYPDEHYVQTFLHIMDPMGISNWSVTYVDWSEGKWHPRSYKKEDITLSTLRRIQMINESTRLTSGAKKQEIKHPCIWNGRQQPCYLFARKFLPEAEGPLLNLWPNITKLPLEAID